MLIITRKINEKIILDNKITITILNIRKNQATIGIHAPKEVSIYRKEIYKICNKKKSL